MVVQIQLAIYQLTKINPETAYLNACQVVNRIRSKYQDQTKVENSKKFKDWSSETKKHSRRSAITTFEHCIIFSDSLGIGANATDAALFVEQLSRLLVDIANEQLQNFKERIPGQMTDIPNQRARYVDTDKNIRYPSAFPILFRGGLSIGSKSEILFQPVIQIEEKGLTPQGLSIIGIPYVEAVQLEKFGKGPRLFCSSQLAKILQKELDPEKEIIKQVDENVSEIIWTYYAVKDLSLHPDPEKNIDDAIKNLLTPVLNLAGYYWKEGAVVIHYLEFLKLIWEGILLYAHIHNYSEEQIQKVKMDMTNCWYKNQCKFFFSEAETDYVKLFL